MINIVNYTRVFIVLIIILIMPVTLYQWNSRSISCNGGELKNFLANIKMKSSIIAIQETWLTPNKSFEMSGYTAYRKDRTTGSGAGCITLIDDRLPSYEINTDDVYNINSLSNVNIVVTVVLHDDTRTTCCNIYNAFRSSITND